MKFKAYTDKELEELRLLPDGEYKAVITESSDAKDKNGNDMFKFKLKMPISQGRTMYIIDWASPSSPEKFKNAFYSAGMIDKYDSEECHSKDFIGKNVRILIYAKPDEDGKKWNRVKDYVYKSNNTISSDFVDSDIPDSFL